MGRQPESQGATPSSHLMVREDKGCWSRLLCPQQLSVSEEAGMLPQAQLLTVLHVKPGAELDFRDPTLAAKKTFLFV